MLPLKSVDCAIEECKSDRGNARTSYITSFVCLRFVEASFALFSSLAVLIWASGQCIG